MDFKKKIDYDDINSFLPDNFLTGTKEYYSNKFNGNMPDYVCEYLEIKSRPEFNNEKENDLKIELIKKKAREENLKIIQEYEEIVQNSFQQKSPKSIEDDSITPLQNILDELDLEDRKGMENVVCCDIKENISSER